MNATAYVDHAAGLTKRLVARETTGPGDTCNAMRRIEARDGIPYGVQWALRYRRPKSIAADIYDRIIAAAERQRQHQEKQFDAERAAINPQTWLGRAFVRAADAVAGQESGMIDFKEESEA